MSSNAVISSLASLPVSTLKGVGPKVVERLQKLAINNVQDLLFHLPLRYEDRTRIYPIADLMAGTHVSVMGEVIKTDVIFGKRRMMTSLISDGTGHILLRFFNFSAAQKNALSPGKQIRCFGEIRRGKKQLEMSHPEYKFIGDEPTTVAETLTPVYPTTEGLRQSSLRQFTQEALAMLQRHEVTELLPQGLLPVALSLKEALMIIHRPPPDTITEQLEQGTHPAQQRLIYEELLAQSLSMLKLRQQTRQHKAATITPDQTIINKFLTTLPFAPTGAQQRVVQEIHHDIAAQYPMMRLVQGDVGSGKTLVAALAALPAIAAGYQVALMAPTELLAEQHAMTFNFWLESLGIQVAWLAGKVKGKARVSIMEQIASGEAQFIVGTHALFQDAVTFKNLALIIIDEQHRFGVGQRLGLREKGAAADSLYPHQLVMTATPIPRTLAMTAWADLDVSVIDELPPGRTPVTTVAIPNSRRDDIIQRVKESCLNDKRQVYWVCTLIDESEVLQCEAAEDTATNLQAVLPELKIGLVHGRMKSDEKQQVMDAFKQAELDLLVATTVIEVGVDVPNASLMIIENPERLGLAQLHQLRGRVGRGQVESHCVLLYNPPLSNTAQKRLSVLRETNDGFKIAQKDLEIRGPGEVLGTRQTGLAQLKIADLLRDAELIPHVQQAAKTLWSNNPTTAQQLIQRWLPDREIYSQA